MPMQRSASSGPRSASGFRPEQACTAACSRCSAHRAVRSAAGPLRAQHQGALSAFGVAGLGGSIVGAFHAWSTTGAVFLRCGRENAAACCPASDEQRVRSACRRRTTPSARCRTPLARTSHPKCACELHRCPPPLVRGNTIGKRRATALPCGHGKAMRCAARTPGRLAGPDRRGIFHFGGAAQI
jgi:hypothetical protein